ncbi:UDP-N-acetylmuramoyl-L-alanine--D-glutamate ligase [Hathewaya massiliensis]|uniref:UDP-N-acetylmuramoyl-L-alanine--D-glutamate ligase n=1 Tax=Hathewaya massiliensis TaxID=1964382 RepID=UPI0011577D99|nr:UDP-N-acetylmuramoyl-L-alanine--D-glutamate ligase [Hathewaya massiliensis]
MKKNFSEFKTFIKDKKVGVVGIGVSNVPLIYFLLDLGAKITALDKKTEDKLDESLLVDFKRRGVNLKLGESYLDDLTPFNVIFKSPSMRIDNEAFVKAKESGSYITSEMEEFVRYCPAKIYGVTGSDGKTTTTTLIYNMLKTQGYKTWVGGNIGTPLFSKIEEIKPEDKVVIELSSFQLMTMNVSPEVAVVTNLSPNHLDMHKGMEEYVHSKKNIFKYQHSKDLLILNRENDITYSFLGEEKGTVKLFSSKRQLENGAYYKDGVLYLDGEEVCNGKDIIIRGMHNIENYLTAFLAVQGEVSKETMKKVATSFKGVHHRNEFIKEVNGVGYYNDSIGSSPTRTLATISSFHSPVILIAGGYDKQIPFEPLAENGYDKIKSLILLGTTREKIKAVFEKIIEEKKLNISIYMVNSLEEAVEKSMKVAKTGDTVVLSPACASFDMFPNFEVRGNKFKELVENLK